MKKGLNRPMVMDGGKINKLKECCVVEDIEHHRKKEKMTELERMKEIDHLCVRLG